MHRVTRLDDLAYPIFVGGDVPKQVATFVRERGFARTIILCDRNVAAYARRIGRAIPGAKAVAFELGERRKRLATLELALDALAELNADRDTLVIGVGGGVAGDLFGFAAAVYMRGVPFLNVATSLVAMVDAAVGGKTGVDLRAGKNLAGAFRDPVGVFADVNALSTLPQRSLREGLAEVVKHGIIEGGDAFESLETLAPHPLYKWPWETIVAESIRVKSMIVADDRVEHGSRETLNLGHTIGHAIEHVSGYRTSHGAAIAMGLRAAGLLALRTGRFSTGEHLRVLSLLALLRLPFVSPVGDVSALLASMSHDKKSRNGALRFVLPRAIGDVEYGVTVPQQTVRTVLQRLTQTPGEREFR